MIHDKFGISALEVTDEVSNAPTCRHQAEDPAAHDQGHHGGHAGPLGAPMRVVVALGGDALLERGEVPRRHAERQQKHVIAAVDALVPLARDHDLRDHPR